MGAAVPPELTATIALIQDINREAARRARNAVTGPWAAE